MSDDIVAKVQKLMRLAERAGTPEEAELAFSKAQELMVKHAIDEANLREQGFDVEREEIVTKYVTLKNRDEIRNSKVRLYMGIAEANGCRVLLGHDYVVIVGRKSATEFVEMLFASILIQYAGERTREWKAYNRRHGGRPPLSRFRWVTSFSYGYAERIGERLKETIKAVPGSGLVLYDAKSEVDDWLSANMRVGKGRALRRSISWEARSQGSSAANRADVSGGRNNVDTKSKRALG